MVKVATGKVFELGLCGSYLAKKENEFETEYHF